jgi:hypothetical protein
VTSIKQTSSDIREGGWVVRRIDVPDPLDAECMAETNERLPNNWKYTLEIPGNRSYLRLDVSEPYSESLGDPLEKTAAPRVPSSPEWLGEIQHRIEALRYPCHSRNDRLIVSLDVWQAEVAPETDGCVACSVVAGAPASEASRKATAILVLRAGGSMRIVRGYLAPLPLAKAGFMARLASNFSDEQLAEVLEALAVCCRRFQKSVSVLQNEGVAQRYLALSAIYSYQSKGELQSC